MKKRRLTLIFLILLIGGGVGLYFFGAGMIERFVLSRVQSLAATYLHPTLKIQAVKYQFPLTVHVTGLTMELEGTTILDVPTGSITLDTIPYSRGQVRFAGFELNDPVLRFTVNKDDQLVGWGNFVKDIGDDDDDTPPIRNSDAFAMRKVSVSNGTIEYHDVDDPTRTMRLDDITIDLDADNADDVGDDEPKNADIPADAPDIPRGQNWYQIDATLDRSPIVKVTLDCGLDIDTGNVIVRLLGVNTKLDPDAVDILPPQLQSFVEEHRMAGSYTSSLWGSVIADDPLEGPLRLESTLTDANFTSEDGTLEIKRIDTSYTLKRGVLILTNLKGDLLGGTIEADGEILLEEEPPRPRRRALSGDTTAADDESVEMTDGRPIYSIIAGVQLDKVDLARLTGSREESSRIRGELDLDVEMTGLADQLPATLEGTGFISVQKGRLANIPVLSALGRVVNVILLRNADSDRLQSDLTLRPDGVVMEQIVVTAGLMAARGRGIVRFNDTLLFVLNAGPLERIQNSIGAIGRAMGAITDRIVRYEVSGEIGEPRVRVRPFGINVGDPTAPPPPTPAADKDPDTDSGS